MVVNFGRRRTCGLFLLTCARPPLCPIHAVLHPVATEGQRAHAFLGAQAPGVRAGAAGCCVLGGRAPFCMRLHAVCERATARIVWAWVRPPASASMVSSNSMCGWSGCCFCWSKQPSSEADHTPLASDIRTAYPSWVFTGLGLALPSQRDSLSWVGLCQSCACPRSPPGLCASHMLQHMHLRRQCRCSGAGS